MVWQLRVCWFGAPCLTRGRVCRLYNCCWPSPEQSFSGPSPVGLVAVFYCLRFETSLFIASYDSLVWVWVLCYDRRWTGQSVLEQSTHQGLMTRSLLHVWRLRSCSYGAPSLTRGRVCPLYMLLALASAVFLGSETLGTWDHILLSHIWDFTFRRLLRLAGSRWRYSIPPPHWELACLSVTSREVVSSPTD
jgi:hypothetical protein